ncbi:DUF6891 domain-containing protein [Nocardioides sp. L-11A]|uniref:DUF6891 domain-containing protein n=1 Tax=Nocardioides sp. L-11A TaxID=3043848 RepID=UPI00249B857B|nr:hypothetical protein QJ852_03915 [Nocardioides sp. L-11A]
MGIFDRFRKRRPGDDTTETAGDAGPARLPEPDPPAHPLNQQPEGFRLPGDLGLPADTETRLRAFLWDGVLTSAEPDLLDVWGEEIAAEGIGDEQADRAFEAVLAARRAQQASWGPDDVLPLTSAFAALADAGIVARENFSCCGTCASAEIADERDDSRTWRGYVYYHQQDTESLLSSRSTYVGYGAFLDAFMTEEEWLALSDADKEATYERLTVDLMVGDVLPVLERHGVRVEWNRELGTRILLDDVDTVVLV